MSLPLTRSKLLVATTNDGKLRELKGLMAGIPIELINLSDISIVTEVEETGMTFAENAVLKACGYARQAGILTIADDSGLEVRALKNRPGVFSARYAGRGTGFDQKIKKLLKELQGSGIIDRAARFVCSVAISDAEGSLLFSAEGICNGTIAAKPRGKNGFGYDPVFIPDDFDQTFGELSDLVKQKISHRANAFDQIIPFLRDYIAI